MEETGSLCPTHVYVKSVYHVWVVWKGGRDHLWSQRLESKCKIKLLTLGKFHLIFFFFFAICFDSGIQRWEKNWARKKVMPSVGWTSFCSVAPFCVRFSYLLPTTLCLEERGTTRKGEAGETSNTAQFAIASVQG